MRFVSLFSGIEAASVAWEALGWECAAFAEIAPFPRRLLAERWPHVRNLGDVTEILLTDLIDLGPVDVVIFGSPCQDLSLAGNRKGLEGERSGLFHDAMRIVRWLRDHAGLRWALWENVHGAFSSNEGRDFAVVVEAMGGGPAVAVPMQRGKQAWGDEGAFAGQEALVEWSTLDAQWFGVAQRRRRVFALADFGDWASRPPVLLEPDCLRGDSAPRRQTWEETAGGIAGGLGEGGIAQDGRGLPEVVGTIAVNAGPRSHDKGNFTSNQGVAAGYVIPCVSNAEGTLELPYLTVSNLAKQFNNQQPLVFAAMGIRETADPLTTNEQSTWTHEGMTFRTRNVVPGEYGVRRLTPLECERLQGFADHWTRLANVKDSPRYEALGNSMAVPVIRWIGRSIERAHNYNPKGFWE